MAKQGQQGARDLLERRHGTAKAPASPISVLHRLQRGEEGQRRSPLRRRHRGERDRAAGKEQAARDLVQRRQPVLLSASESAAAPASPIWFRSSLQRGEQSQGCSTGPLAQSRARETYYSDLSVALLLSASESAAAPASPIWLQNNLQRG